MEKPINEQEVKKETTISFHSFIQTTYQAIDQLKGDSIIDTDDIYDLALLNGFDAEKRLINETMINLGFKKFDIPGHIEKIWLVEEILQTQ